MKKKILFSSFFYFCFASPSSQSFENITVSNTLSSLTNANFTNITVGSLNTTGLSTFNDLTVTGASTIIGSSSVTGDMDVVGETRLGKTVISGDFEVQSGTISIDGTGLDFVTKTLEITDNQFTLSNPLLTGASPGDPLYIDSNNNVFVKTATTPDLNFLVVNNLTVNDNTILGGSVADALTVNATPIFNNGLSVLSGNLVVSSPAQFNNNVTLGSLFSHNLDINAQTCRWNNPETTGGASAYPLFIDATGKIFKNLTPIIVTDLEISNNFEVKGSMTVGDSAVDIVTMNAGEWTYVNPTDLVVLNSLNINPNNNTTVTVGNSTSTTNMLGAVNINTTGNGMTTVGNNLNTTAFNSATTNINNASAATTNIGFAGSGTVSVKGNVGINNVSGNGTTSIGNTSNALALCGNTITVMGSFTLNSPYIFSALGNVVLGTNSLNTLTVNSIASFPSGLSSAGPTAITAACNINSTGGATTNVGTVSVGTTNVKGAVNINNSASDGNTVIGNTGNTLSIVGVTNINTASTSATTLGSTGGTVAINSSTTNINRAGAGTTNLGFQATGIVDVRGTTDINTTSSHGNTNIGNINNTVDIQGTVDINQSSATNTRIGNTGNVTIKGENAITGVSINDNSGVGVTTIGTSGTSGKVTIGNSNNEVEINSTININTSGTEITTIGNGTAGVDTNFDSILLRCPNLLSSGSTSGTNNLRIRNSGQPDEFCIMRHTSSRRYKKNIKPLSDIDTKDVYSVTPVKYNAQEGVLDYGIIAEELEEKGLFLDAIGYDRDQQVDSLNYEQIYIAALHQLQELNKRVIALEECSVIRSSEYQDEHENMYKNIRNLSILIALIETKQSDLEERIKGIEAYVFDKKA